MLFKPATIAGVVAAAFLAATANAAAVQRRQVELATCNFVVTPSGTPDPSALLSSEFNYLIGRTLHDYIPHTSSSYNQGSTVTGPSDAGTYSVDDSIGADDVTGAEVAAILTSWVGNTFVGPWSGVNWLIDAVTC